MTAHEWSRLLAYTGIAFCARCGERKSMSTKERQSRAVIAPLQGGGMIMLSCTSEGADMAEAFIEESRKARKVVDIQRHRERNAESMS